MFQEQPVCCDGCPDEPASAKYTVGRKETVNGQEDINPECLLGPLASPTLLAPGLFHRERGGGTQSGAGLNMHGPLIQADTKEKIVVIC